MKAIVSAYAMRTHALTDATALFGQLTTLVSTIMLSRLLVRLGAGRAAPAEALLELALGAGATWFWLSLIGAGVWGGAWRLAERGGRSGARAGRVAMLYLGQLAALAAVLLQAMLMIALWLTQPRPAGTAAQAVELAAGGGIALTFWGFLRWNASKTGDSGDEPAAGANWRRLYYYGGAAVTLALFLAGLMELLRIILGVAAGVGATNRARFAQAAAFALAAAPAWWALWWAQQTRAAAPGEAGAAERRARLRRLYLYAIILVTAVAFFFGLGMSIFGAIIGRDLAIVAAWAPIALISLVCLTGHLLTLAGDERALAEASRPDTPPLRAAAGSAPIPSTRPLPAAEPRRFARATLPPAPIPGRPPIILVVDGGDGALGAKLMAALAAGLPHAILWPLGLNAAAHVALLDAVHHALGGASARPPGETADKNNRSDDFSRPARHGATKVATAEQAISRATLIVGPSDMLIPGGLAGEVTAELAAAIAASAAAKLLLPPRSPTLRWVAAPAWPEDRWVENAVIEAVNALGEGR